MGGIKNVAVIGAGNVGGSIINSLKNSGALVDIIGTVTTLEGAKMKFGKYRVSIHDSNKYLNNTFTSIIAVKPNNVEEVCHDLNRYLPLESSVIGVTSGVSLDKYHKLLGKNRMIARCKPDTLISTGNGIITWYSEPKNTKYFDRLLLDLFKPNKLVKLDNEIEMDDPYYR